MIGTYSTMHARSAVREVGEGARHPRGGDRRRSSSGCRTSRRSRRLEEACAGLARRGGTCRSIASRSAPSSRSHGASASSRAIWRPTRAGSSSAPEPITGSCRSSAATRGYEITQWAMNEVEAAGLIKIDIIGQKGLAVIEEPAARRRRTRAGASTPSGRLPRRPARPRVLRAGRTEGCFYIESPIMMQLLEQAALRRLRGADGAFVDHTPRACRTTAASASTSSATSGSSRSRHAPAARAGAARHLRLPHLPGAGDPASPSRWPA